MQHKNAILVIILVSYVMILLYNSVIFTSLPSLQADLHLSSPELAWVQDSYTLVFGGLLPLGARAGDLLGRKRVFIVGLVFAILNASEHGWASTPTLVGFAAAVVALVSFVFAESRAEQPIMPLRLFTSRERTGAYLTRFFFFTSQLLQRVLGFSALQAGLAGTTAEDAGAASRVVNTFHQVGSSLGLEILVAIASMSGAAVQHASAASRLAVEVSAALTAGSTSYSVAALNVGGEHAGHYARRLVTNYPAPA